MTLFEDSLSLASGLRTAALPRGVAEGADAPARAATPYRIAVGEAFDGRISGAADRDWVAITLEQGQSYVFSAFGTGGSEGLADPVLALRGPGGGVLRQNDDISGGDGNLFSRLVFTAPTTGTYFLDIGGGGAGTYRVEAARDVFTVADVVTQITQIEWGETAMLRHDERAGSDAITYNVDAMTPEGRQLALWALDAWSEASGLAFTRTTGPAELTFDDNRPGAFAELNAYDPSSGTITRASVNVAVDWLVRNGTSYDSYSYWTYLHEVGHALGLGHAGTYSSGGVYGVDNHFRNDSVQMTVMSYFSLHENPFVGADRGNVVSPMIADLAAVRQMYGGGPIEAGNTVWGSNTNVGGSLGQLMRAVFDDAAVSAAFYSGTNVAFTIADTGGTDMLDLSRETAAQRIDLTPGGISDTRGRNGNLVIAEGTVIENVRGGAGADTIFGNAAANTITGNAGNDDLSGGAEGDMLWGGAGNDRLFGGTFDPGLDPARIDVYRIFQAVFGRDPDIRGSTYWSEQIAKGQRSYDGVIQGFTGSAEFRATYAGLSDREFVETLYRNVLGRDGDAGGVTYWAQEIVSGNRSRVEVISAFSKGPEFMSQTAGAAFRHTGEGFAAEATDDVFRIYQATLDRTPDESGFLYWAGALAEGTSALSVIKGFMNSTEFRAAYGSLGNAEFVAQLYRNVLGREADDSGKLFWTTQLDSSARNRAQVVQNFAQGPEFVRSSADDLDIWLRSLGTDDTLDPGAGSNLVAGGLGSDSFLFRAGDKGINTVADPEPWDTFRFIGWSFDSFPGLRAAARETGGDVVIAEAGASVTLSDIRLADLTSDMFQFA